MQNNRRQLQRANPANHFPRLTTHHLMAALVCLVIGLHIIYSMSRKLHEFEQLNEGLLARIDELETRNRRLEIGAEFGTEHVQSLERMLENCRTNEVGHVASLQLARQKLLACTHPA